jgi:hypothetical protein
VRTLSCNDPENPVRELVEIANSGEALLSLVEKKGRFASSLQNRTSVAPLSRGHRWRRAAAQKARRPAAAYLGKKPT